MKDSSGVNYLDMLWHCSQLSYTEEKTYSNKDISSCKHIRKIFKDTRVGVEKQDSEFINEACRRTFDAVSNHPVLFIGKWRQGKSSLSPEQSHQQGCSFWPHRG